MMLMMVLFWGLVIFGIVYAVRALSGTTGTVRYENRNTALETLKERYAKGEISTEEYEEKRRTLAS
ncbi:MAG: SHOCT domain-containing protein [Candidatus Aquicultor sp.]